MRWARSLRWRWRCGSAAACSVRCRRGSLGDALRKGLGVAALLAVVAIGLGWDTGLLTRLSTVSTARIEQGLLDAVPGAQPSAPPMMMVAGANAAADAPLPVEGTLPALDGATGWLNSPRWQPSSCAARSC